MCKIINGYGAICAANPGHFRGNGYAPTGSHGAGISPNNFSVLKAFGFSCCGYKYNFKRVEI